MPRSWETCCSIWLYSAAFGSLVSGAAEVGDASACWRSQLVSAPADADSDGLAAALADGAMVGVAADSLGAADAVGLGVVVWGPHAATSSATSSAARPPDRRSGVVIGVECDMSAGTRLRAVRVPDRGSVGRCAFLNRSPA